MSLSAIYTVFSESVTTNDCRLYQFIYHFKYTRRFSTASYLVIRTNQPSSIATNDPLHILRVQIPRREHRTFTITIFFVERLVFEKTEFTQYACVRPILNSTR